MRFFYTLFTIFTVLVFTGCSKEDKEEIAPAKEYTTVEQSSYTIKDISSGAEFTLKRENGAFVVEGHEEKIVMFDMYGTFCPPCRKEAPHLTNLQIKYLDKLIIIALNIFEDVDDSYIDNKFRYGYGAYYFISNSKHNRIIVDTILKDIDYKIPMQLPFKVVLKDAKYQKLTDIYNSNPDNNFYLGAVSTQVIEKDLKKILEN